MDVVSFLWSRPGPHVLVMEVFDTSQCIDFYGFLAVGWGGSGSCCWIFQHGVKYVRHDFVLIGTLIQITSECVSVCAAESK